MSPLSFSARTRRGSAVRIGAMLAALCASALVILASGAFASHVYGTYGNRGYGWLARYYDLEGGTIWVTSDYCNTAEVEAFTDVVNSTAGTTEFAARWPSGLRMERMTCDGVVDNTIDISLDYSDFSARPTAAGRSAARTTPRSRRRRIARTSAIPTRAEATRASCT